jgi:hypothetical protein
MKTATLYFYASLPINYFSRDFPIINVVPPRFEVLLDANLIFDAVNDPEKLHLGKLYEKLAKFDVIATKKLLAELSEMGVLEVYPKEELGRSAWKLEGDIFTPKVQLYAHLSAKEAAKIGGELFRAELFKKYVLRK